MSSEDNPARYFLIGAAIPLAVGLTGSIVRPPPHIAEAVCLGALGRKCYVHLPGPLQVPNGAPVEPVETASAVTKTLLSMSAFSAWLSRASSSD